MASPVIPLTANVVPGFEAVAVFRTADECGTFLGGLAGASVAAG